MTTSNNSFTLTEEQVKFYNTNGFVAVPNAISSKNADALASRAKELAKQYDFKTISVFSTESVIAVVEITADNCSCISMVIVTKF